MEGCSQCIVRCYSPICNAVFLLRLFFLLYTSVVFSKESSFYMSLHMMYASKRVAVRELNPHILCALCGGYLIQATTVIECLHSFCRSCIVNFLETSKVCPICDAQIHKTRPLLNIRPDQTLQSLVYKLVPGLFQDEMRRRREFHATLSESDVEDLSLEERGEASLEKEFKPGDDHVSLVLQLAFRENKTRPFEIRDRRYLLCPSEVTVKHLKKFIRMKFQLNESHKIEMYRAREELTDDLMLQDIALIYSWRRETPMNLCYLISESRRSRSGSWRKHLISKQPDVCSTAHESPTTKSTELPPKHKQPDVCSTAHESPTAKSTQLHPKHKQTFSAHLDISIPLKTETDVELLTPISKSSASDSTSASVTPLSTAEPSPSSTLSSSVSSISVSNHVAVTEEQSSAGAGQDKTAPKHQKSSTAKTVSETFSVINIKLLKTKGITSTSLQPKPTASTSIVSSIETKSNSAAKSKSISVKHDVKHDVKHNVKQDVKRDVKQDVKHNVKQDVKRDVKHDAKHDAEQDVKHNGKRDVKREVKHDAEHDIKNATSKLMHSVESILNKTPKQVIHKTNTSTLSWNPVSELPPSGSLSKEKLDKTIKKTTKNCHREQQSSEASQRQTSDCEVSKSSECGSQVVVGIKRSQSVIETVSSVAEVCGHALTPQEVVGSDPSGTQDGLLHADNATDVFSSYIPKLQKHLRMCAVKRSASYEGPSLAPASGAITCVDAMEKRNWKKRKLSTLDFDGSKVTHTDNHVNSRSNLTSTSKDNNSRNSSCQPEHTTLTPNQIISPPEERPLPQGQVDSGKLPELTNTSPAMTQPSGHPKPPVNKSSISPPRDQSTTHSVSYLPFLLPPTGNTASSPAKPQSKHSSDSKVKSLSRKTNGTPTSISSAVATKNNNKVSCGNRHKDVEKLGKVDQIKTVSSQKQLCVLDSDSVTNKPLGYGHNKSVNSRSISTLVEVSTNGSYVEEICVDTSSSPSDNSNVTSPATYVTSPGTEDRTDGSALPDIQTSCDTNCRVTFSGKMPLDLSVKKK